MDRRPNLKKTSFHDKKPSSKKLEEEHQDDNIKCMILCNPSNPTGGVHNEERLKELANVLEDYPQIAILADEIYERLVYIDTPADEHVSFASISPNMYQRTMTITLTLHPSTILL